MQSFDLKTYNKCALVNITRQVREAVHSSGVREGCVVVASPHTTAGITVNENADPDVAADILAGLEGMVPNISYRHGEGNSDAHIKSSLVGTSAALPIANGDVALGTWQAIYFCEFDGPRDRKFTVSIVGSSV